MNLERGIHKEVIEARENKDEKLTLKKTVDTFPLENGGSNFKTHKLVRESDYQYAFRPTIFALIFCSIFIFIGIGIALYQFKSFQKFGIDSNEFSYIASIGSLMFFGVGCYILSLIYTPRIFNKRDEIYYKSVIGKSLKTDKNVVDLRTVKALQIIGELVQDDDGAYRSFELNLVLEDSSRINVTDHGNLKALIRDAEELSRFLNIPIWHATSHLEV